MTDHVVLVIGEIGDWSADTVADTVTKAGGRVFRLTTYDFPQRMQLAATFDGRWSGTITTSESRLCLDTVTGVYYRRPRTFDLPAAMSGPELRFARAQARVGLGGILASLPARWINHPSVLADAEYKPRQLAAAAEAGLRTPATLITNDPQAVRSFADNVGHLVVKPLAEASVAEAGALSVAYTRQMTTDDYRDLSGGGNHCSPVPAVDRAPIRGAAHRSRTPPVPGRNSRQLASCAGRLAVRLRPPHIRAGPLPGAGHSRNRAIPQPVRPRLRRLRLHRQRRRRMVFPRMQPRRAVGMAGRRL